MIKLKHLLPECNECSRDWNHGHDHEAGMAKNELRDMISNASKIDHMVGEGDNLPGWVSAYISLAADYMHSVAEYLAGESSRMQEPGPGYGLEEGEIEFVSLKDFSKNLELYKRGDISKSQLITSYNRLKAEDQKKAKELAKGLEVLPNPSKLSAPTSMEEAKKPSTGLTKAQKSAVAKKAHAGKDIGKKGPGFEKVAKAAEKKYGSKEAGQKVAAAAMWKSVKRK